MGYRSCDAAGNCYDQTPGDRLLFVVNGQAPASGAPFSDPCLAGSPERRYRAAYIQLDMKVTRRRNEDGSVTDNYGWHDPQGRIAVLEDDIAATLAGRRETEPLFFRANSGECVLFQGTNLFPSVLNLDDFQVYTPTDTIGQHIHLVKFDVTSSDGSANGWNYEDGTFSPDEVIERIKANNAWQTAHSGSAFLTPKTHRLFQPGGAMAGDPRGQCSANPDDWHKTPWCGAQSTVQRWWADPQLAENGHDKTLRTVFSHDHFGPSSHQQHGLYSALVIEPKGSNWTDIFGAPLGGITSSGQVRQLRSDGGPTSFAANILPSEHSDSREDARREFNLAIADYVPLYICQNPARDGSCARDVPVNPPGQIDEDLPRVRVRTGNPKPEGISTVDPGGQTINYRTEPLVERIAERKDDGSYRQWPVGTVTDECRQRNEAGANAPESVVCDRGDLANAFSSVTHGDPATPLLQAYAGDKVQVRLIQGSQEENHVVSIHGVKWFAQPGRLDSGYTTAQQLGISEHFEFNLDLFSAASHASTDHLYMSTATDDLWSGAWGLMRSYGFMKQNTQGVVLPAPLPNNPYLDHYTNPQAPSGICREGQYDAGQIGSFVQKTIVAAWARKTYEDGTLSYNQAYDITDPNAIALYDADDAGYQTKKPLVLRVNAGDCLQLSFNNLLTVDAADSASPATLGDSARPLPELVPGLNTDPRDGWTYNRLPALVDELNTNTTRMSQRIGFHIPGLASNLLTSEGAHVGHNSDSTVPPGANTIGRPLDLYAGHYITFPEKSAPGSPGEIGQRHIAVEFGVLPIVAMGDAIQHGSHGALGALVVEPRGAEVALDTGRSDSATVKVRDDKGKVVDSFREFVVIYQDDAAVRRHGTPLPNLGGEGNSNDSGQRAWNLSTEPLWARVGAEPSLEPGEFNRYDWSHVFSSIRCADNTAGQRCAPGTQVLRDPPLVFTAKAGEKIRFRIVQPSGHPRNHAFALVGHNWVDAPWNDGDDPLTGSSVLVDRDNDTERKGGVNGIGPRRHINLLIDSAGGPNKVPGDYLFYTFDSLSLVGGMWGILRVTP
jgi:hypothetical protein